MKFAHAFEAALRQEEYPSRWIQSAISYRQLKKCIKEVQKELYSIGFDPTNIARIWPTVKEDAHWGHLQYEFGGATQNLDVE